MPRGWGGLAELLAELSAVGPAVGSVDGSEDGSAGGLRDRSCGTDPQTCPMTLRCRRRRTAGAEHGVSPWQNYM
ncbi:MAG: hypothetical protein BGO26_01890 [Actinobacteria bacterium 69-20]|nr:MAG: hypothetical protein BGO26_01890 [Actinobacteria bacterium 69-20]